MSGIKAKTYSALSAHAVPYQITVGELIDMLQKFDAPHAKVFIEENTDAMCGHECNGAFLLCSYPHAPTITISRRLEQ